MLHKVDFKKRYFNVKTNRRIREFTYFTHYNTGCFKKSTYRNKGDYLKTYQGDLSKFFTQKRSKIMKKFMLTIATVVSASIIFAGCAKKNDTTKVSETTEQVVDTTDVVEDVVEEPVVTEESVAEDPVEDVVTNDDSIEDTDTVEDDTIDLSFLMGDYEDVLDRSIFTCSYDYAWCTGYLSEDESMCASTLRDGALTDDSEVYPGVTFKTFCDGLDDVLDHPVNRDMLRMTLSLDVFETSDNPDKFTIPVIISDYLYFIENPTTIEEYSDNNVHHFITVDDKFTFKFTITIPDGEILINDKESDFPTVTEEVENSYKSKIETALGL